jgi:hypothetical protein
MNAFELGLAIVVGWICVGAAITLLIGAAANLGGGRPGGGK